MRYFYTSISRWPAIADAHALAATDVLTDDSELPLNDDTRVRITVRMRRDARQFVTVRSERWYDVIDRLDGSIEWYRPIPLCGPSRSMVLTPLPTCAGMI
ncbi:MAG: hypothetical protein QOI25_1645 [Mycobacterium sp.]|nr:hypothetical protein [Mycobacterium sp.]